MTMIAVMEQRATPITVQQIQHDIYCVHCSYNLRTLPTAGKCPECGFPVADSLARNYIHYADPSWLKRMMYGATIVSLSFLVMLMPALLFLTPLMVFGAVLHFCGAWLLTSPREQGILMGESQALRKTVRILYCAWLLSLPAVFLAAFSSGTLVVSIVDCLSVLIPINMLASYFLLLVYLNEFTSQMPAARLRVSSKTVIWGLLICSVVLGAISFLAVLLEGTVRGWDTGIPIGRLVELLLLLIMLGFGVLWLWSIALFWMYRGQFGAQSKRGKIRRAGLLITVNAGGDKSG